MSDGAVAGGDALHQWHRGTGHGAGGSVEALGEQRALAHEHEHVGRHVAPVSALGDHGDVAAREVGDGDVPPAPGRDREEHRAAARQRLRQQVQRVAAGRIEAGQRRRGAAADGHALQDAAGVGGEHDGVAGDPRRRAVARRRPDHHWRSASECHALQYAVAVEAEPLPVGREEQAGRALGARHWCRGQRRQPPQEHAHDAVLAAAVGDGLAVGRQRQQRLIAQRRIGVAERNREPRGRLGRTRRRGPPDEPPGSQRADDQAGRGRDEPSGPTGPRDGRVGVGERALHRVVQLEPRVADVAQPPPRVLVEAAAQQPSERRRRAGGQQAVRPAHARAPGPAPRASRRRGRPA